MKSHFHHAVWCNISGKAAGETWIRSLLAAKGLTLSVVRAWVLELERKVARICYLLKKVCTSRILIVGPVLCCSRGAAGTVPPDPSPEQIPSGQSGRLPSPLPVRQPRPVPRVSSLARLAAPAGSDRHAGGDFLAEALIASIVPSHVGLVADDFPARETSVHPPGVFSQSSQQLSRWSPSRRGAAPTLLRWSGFLEPVQYARRRRRPALLLCSCRPRPGGWRHSSIHPGKYRRTFTRSDEFPRIALDEWRRLASTVGFPRVHSDECWSLCWWSAELPRVRPDERRQLASTAGFPRVNSDECWSTRSSSGELSRVRPDECRRAPAGLYKLSRLHSDECRRAPTGLYELSRLHSDECRRAPTGLYELSWVRPDNHLWFCSGVAACRGTSRNAPD